MRDHKHHDIPMDWLKGLKSNEPEAKEERKKTILGAAHVLLMLRKILEDKYETKVSTKDSDYDCPSWAYKQADHNGYLRAIEDILKLLPKP